MSEIEVNHLTKTTAPAAGSLMFLFKSIRANALAFWAPTAPGKSTTIRHLMGFSKPDSGETKILGKESFAHYDEVLHEVGYIPGEIALPVGFTGYEFLKMEQDLQGIHNAEQQKKMLNLFQLEDNVLRGRNQTDVPRRQTEIGYCRCLPRRPQSLILDEPTSGLDPLMQEVFVDLIHSEKKRAKRFCFQATSSRKSIRPAIESPSLKTAISSQLSRPMISNMPRPNSITSPSPITKLISVSWPITAKPTTSRF
jgi:ABC-2 type transport system ATP-binding protein